MEIERNDERRKREQTESMLRVLGQSVGGIVHDLGNPLTIVQGGADSLRYAINGNETDTELVKEFADMISSGAEMLNFLRLSLIEQTRVLDGTPTPVEARPVALRKIVEAGARFQKPYAKAGREIQIECDDTPIVADEMKMTTVFMNLIGNALKYSDGEVCVRQREYSLPGESGEKKVVDCVFRLRNEKQGHHARSGDAAVQGFRAA